MSGVVEKEEEEWESWPRALDWSPQLPSLTLFFCFIFVFVCLPFFFFSPPPYPLSSRQTMAPIRRIWRGSGC